MTNKPLLNVLGGRAAPKPPIWLMRQAGRHLPEYRRVRAEAGGFLDLVCDPERAAEVTLQPVHRYGLDGSILFSDILVIPWALGQDLWFETGEGPKLGEMPERFDFNIDRLSPIFETLRRLSSSLGGSSVTQLGFVGAPWTVATYMIEQGKPQFEKSQAYLETRQAEALFEVLIEATIAYAKAQVVAGAEVIQIFDSWAGQLSQEQQAIWSFEPMARIGAALAPTPLIYFPRGVDKSLKSLVSMVEQPFAIAVGERSSMVQIREDLGPDICLQGNLDPQVLLGAQEAQETAVDRLLAEMRGTPHIFNLGHGIDKATDPRRVQALVDQVKAG